MDLVVCANFSFHAQYRHRVLYPGHRKCADDISHAFSCQWLLLSWPQTTVAFDHYKIILLEARDTCMNDLLKVVTLELPQIEHLTLACDSSALFIVPPCLQCFAAVGWAAGRASGL